MADPTKDPNKVSDDEQFEKDTERFQEIKKKPETERTEDEKKEFGDLKERYGKRMQKKIDELSWRTKSAEEKATEAEKRATEAEQKTKDLEAQLKKDKDKAPVTESYIEIGGKKWLTDETLSEQINIGKITEAEAIKYQRSRNKEEAVQEAVTRIKQEDQKKTMTEIVKKDAEEVIAKYPHFKKDHPDFNPEDPLYKLTIELYQEGYAANPKGLSKAVERAEQILGKHKPPIERDNDFQIEDTDAPAKRGGKNKEITLTEEEKEAVVKIYTRGDVLNPKTGRAYTENEAVTKALQAKKARLSR